MQYLKRRDEAGVLLRSALQVAMPWARSAVVCALNINVEAIGSAPHSALRSIDPAPPGSGWIARYAWTGRALDDGLIAPTDYHQEMLARLRAIERDLLVRADCTTRCYVDTGPILERSVAAEAGVGWIGKNTCLIHPQLGSWILLGVLVTSLPVDEAAVSLPAPDRCGTCTRCIDACPTGALLGSKSPTAPRSMDASRCIAYLTIEKKGPIDASLRTSMGRQVFGCDICQDVCPWNRKASGVRIGTVDHAGISALRGNDTGLIQGAEASCFLPKAGALAEDSLQPRAELVNPSLDWLASLDSREFKRHFKGSPLERTGRKRLLRNVAIAMGNSGQNRFLPQIELWSTADDPVLAEAAQWARARLLA
jgi:epoxyqueuosine reductase